MPDMRALVPAISGPGQSIKCCQCVYSQAADNKTVEVIKNRRLPLPPTRTLSLSLPACTFCCVAYFVHFFCSVSVWTNSGCGLESKAKKNQLKIDQVDGALMDFSLSLPLALSLILCLWARQKFIEPQWKKQIQREKLLG